MGFAHADEASCPITMHKELCMGLQDLEILAAELIEALGEPEFEAVVESKLRLAV